MKSVTNPHFSLNFAGLLFAFLASSLASHAQTLYVSMNAGGKINEVSPLGVVSEFVGGLTTPRGVAFDSSGNLYVAEAISGSLQSVVTKVTPEGGKSTFATGLQNPMDLAFDSSGNLYIADYGTFKISKVGSGGGAVTDFATGLNSPFGLAFNSTGTLFVANRDNDTISQVATNGDVSAFASGFNDPNDLTIDSSGNLYVSNFGNTSVSKVTTAAEVSAFVTDASLVSTIGLAFNPTSGSLYVASQSGSSIIEISSAGSVTNSTFATFGGQGPQYLAFAPTAIPEPSTYGVVAGLTMLGVAAWRRRHRA